MHAPGAIGRAERVFAERPAAMGIDSPSVVLLIIGSALFGLGALVRYGIKQAEKIRGAWRNFADRIGGTYERGRGGVSRIVAPAPRGTVTIDTYLRSDGENTVTYTRLIVPYTPTQPFYFLLRPRGRTGRLLTRLTAKAVERAGAKLPPDQRAYLELE